MDQELLDRLAIRDLVENWALWRDAGFWDKFRTCWHDDGVMMATWTQGTGAEFIEITKKGFYGDSSILHFLGGTTIELNGDRAIVQTKMTISQRAPVHEVWVDVVCTGRFFDFIEKRDDVWRVLLRQPIYEKDRMDPVKSSDLTPDYFENMSLSEFPEACKFMCYRHSKRGLTPSPTLATAGSEIEATLKKEGMAWLESSS